MNTQRKKNLSIPVYGLASLVSGFYIGYQEGEGAIVTPSVEYLSKLGPTVGALILSPVLRKLGQKTNQKMYSIMKKQVEQETLRVKVNNPYEITYKQLKDVSQEQKIQMYPQINKTLNILNEQAHKRPDYVGSMLKGGSRAAFLTLTGYVAGRIYSSLK